MYLISFQYFVHPYGIAFSARYRVLINTMCLWIYCCGMAAHIWWISRVSFLRFVCRGCARTLRFNRSNKWSIGFKSRLFASHVCMLFATSIINVLLAVWHDAISCQHHTEIGTDMKKKKNRPNDVISQLC